VSEADTHLVEKKNCNRERICESSGRAGAGQGTAGSKNIPQTAVYGTRIAVEKTGSGMAGLTPETGYWQPVRWYPR